MNMFITTFNFFIDVSFKVLSVVFSIKVRFLGIYGPMKNLQHPWKTKGSLQWKKVSLDY